MVTAVRPVSVQPGRVAFFDLQRQQRRLADDVRQRIDAVLAHGQFVLGPEVDELEKALAARSGAKQAIAVSSGRDALMIGLMALGVGPGDAVFVPAFTFAATAGAVCSVSATPIFVDVDPDTFNMDPADLARAVAEVEAAGVLEPRVVMPVDLYGLPADYPAIGAIAAAHGMTVFADSAQSYGGALGNRKVGALAPITATSFYPTKPLGCYGDGGAILTEDDGLAEAVRTIRSHGRQGTGDVAVRHGVTGRLDTIQAAILNAKLTVFDDELDRREAIAKRYDAAFAGVLGLQSRPEGYRSAHALYTVKVADRDALKARLDAEGIGNAFFYRVPLHRHPAFADAPVRPLPASEDVAAAVISLPMNPDLFDDEVERVIASVLSAVENA
ncbi:DegT/DnrJ/EryC1/StrS family aminotransferase [Prosthecomicrobium pneumaticum]|uniref:dTDP-4-amino-4,6-dideoxygalactose transaminase n=1 Tax=Prosthecomicrobium pneumaticum TaxID=81895 RepID=A0A7W9L350_9HYPH|nr:DegT/DnrJ/EryC1/StrS aminotransferase family protein [Prosthecomicrobium pneumaticum]MBB5754175.1 dTDP-4-amino-4,6-dideoxygalactose transaminase [Prosthecomicrobium pneumaticum]